MATLPGPLLDRAIRYIIGDSKSPPPHQGTGGGGSLNLKLIAWLIALLHGDDAAADRLESELLGQLDGGQGIYGDEFGGGYAEAQLGVVLAIIQWARSYSLPPGGLLRVARRWYSAALRIGALCAVPHRDSVMIVSPGARRRGVTASHVSLPLQLTLGAPPRMYGIVGDSPPDAVVYRWRDAGVQTLRRLMGGDPAGLARECGVDPAALSAVVRRGEGITGVARGLRCRWPLTIARWSSGDLAAWWSVFQSGDAPCAGSVSLGGEIDSLQPRPIGPRSGKDTQHWGGANVHRAWVDGVLLAAEFTTASGMKSATGPVVTQRRVLLLPAGEPSSVLRVTADRDPEPLAWSAVAGKPTVSPPTPAPGPTPPVTPPAPPTRWTDTLEERRRVVEWLRPALAVWGGLIPSSTWRPTGAEIGHRWSIEVGALIPPGVPSPQTPREAAIELCGATGQDGSLALWESGGLPTAAVSAKLARDVVGR